VEAPTELLCPEYGARGASRGEATHSTAVKDDTYGRLMTPLGACWQSKSRRRRPRAHGLVNGGRSGCPAADALDPRELPDHRLVGTASKVPAAHSYKEELNADLATYQQGADGYWTLARTQHLEECEVRARRLRD
jgi:hypothetical protein